MSISPIVDANYRLQVADLEGAPRRVVIANVTYQGIEEMSPVLHFEGQSKRLVLAPDQVEKIIEITGSALFRQWIGVPIVLQPPSKGTSDIQIRAVSRRQHELPMPVYVSEDRKGWNLALVIVAILLIISALYVALNFEAIMLIAEELRANWPLR